MILYSYLVPISLYVTLEMQKMFGAFLISWDTTMFDDTLEEPARAQCSDLNEELGLVEYVFADKTGTLTQNVMTFRKCSIRGCVYNFSEATRSLESAQTDTDPAGLRACFLAVAICNTVQVRSYTEVRNGADVIVRTYTSSSPDEETLVQAAGERDIGVELVNRTQDTLQLRLDGSDKLTTFKILHVCEFDSHRMRMSVLAETPEGEIMLYCKGADNRVFERSDICRNNDALLERTHAHLKRFSREGLRTLAVAHRTFSDSAAAAVLQKFREAEALHEGRKERLRELYDEIETDMTFLGVTAVEDKLQEGVQDTMQHLRAAGCKVWVLTGDKKETAISISLTCGHTSSDMKLLEIADHASVESCTRAIDDNLNLVHVDKDRLGGVIHGHINASEPVTEAPSRNSSSGGVGGRKTPAADSATGRYGHALVIDGKSVAHAMSDAESEQKLRQLFCECVSVIGCRLSPMQKALVVRLIRSGTTGSNAGLVNHVDHAATCQTTHPLLRAFTPRWPPVTLAIGDGANDVAMIREAHVGVGILGKEGRQAANSSDFAVGKFRFLQNLMLVHGHYCYYRIAYSIQYFFYKNTAMTLPLFLYGFQSLFSAQTLFDSWFIMFFNLFFTALPVLFFGIFEQDLSYEDLMKYPEVYKDFHRNKMMTLRKFLLWVFYGLFHACVAYYGVYYTLTVNPKVTGDMDVSFFGTLVFALMLIMVTSKICVDTRTWTWITHFGVWVGSLGSYVFIIFLYSGVPEMFGEFTTPGAYWVGMTLFSNPLAWAMLALLPVFTTNLDILLILGYRKYAPTNVQRVQLANKERRARERSGFCRKRNDRLVSNRIYEDDAPLVATERGDSSA
eukprot:m.1238722 g.1238722  ORF g.1238722 m.1238722 type:complete len:848 (-) comp24672_c0_seq11:2992-5535(-)